MYRLLAAAICVATLAVAGCNSGNGVTDPATLKAALRVSNLIPDASGPVNVTVDSNTFVSGLAFQSSTAYQEVDSGVRTIQAGIAGGANTILGTPVNLVGATNYSYVMFGTAEAPLGLLLNDTVIDPGAGNIQLRVTNAATGTASVDVYVTPPGASLDAAAPSFANISINTSSAFVTVPAGNQEIRVTPTGNKTVIFDASAVNIAERAAANVIVYTRASGRLVNVALLNIDTTGTTSTTNNLLTQFKVINGSQVASPLNVSINGNLLLSNIPFAAASSYQITQAGSPTLNVEATATPGATLLSFAPTLAPGADTSIVLTGPAGALRPLVLNDNNLPPAITRARVRFVNASIDIGTADVFVNFSRTISGLAMNSALSTELDADATSGTPYEFDVNIAGTTQNVLKLQNVLLTGGKTYSVYLVGSATALRGVVTQDD